jgi:hypothetical protein
LVTPDLQGRIVAEVQRLDLAHVPMRFEDATDHGQNLFEMALDSRQQVSKSRVLSEGEQRALGIACFMAEMDVRSFVPMSWTGSIARGRFFCCDFRWIGHIHRDRGNSTGITCGE